MVSGGWNRFACLVLTALSVLAESWAVLEWVWNPPHAVAAVIFAMLHMAFVALVPVMPAMFAYLAVGLACVYSLTPFVAQGPSQIWGAAFALGVLFFRERTFRALAGYLLYVACQSFDTAILRYAGNDWRSTLAISMLMLLPCVAGYVMRRQCEFMMLRRRLDAMAARERRRRHDDAVALAIHDGISGELSLAVREAQRAQRKLRELKEGLETGEGREARKLPDSGAAGAVRTDAGMGVDVDAECRTWLRMEEYLCNALDGVRQVVAYLHEASPTVEGAVVRGVSRSPRMRETFAAEDAARGEAGRRAVPEVRRDGIVDADGDRGMSVDLAEALVQVMEAEGRRLRGLGYSGRWGCSGSGGSAKSEAGRECIALLRELYANIVRHGAVEHGTGGVVGHGDGFWVSVFVAADAVWVCSENDVPGEVVTGAADVGVGVAGIDPDDAAVVEGGTASGEIQSLVGGYGLGAHAGVIRRLGGRCSYGLETGRWTVRAMIPL